MNFNDKYNRIKKLVQSELDIIQCKMVSNLDIREPLRDSVEHFLLSPSKRIRSLLVILYLKSLGKIIAAEQFEVLTSVELAHNASLIHDDIIDNSELRRGEKSINCEFGNKLAVIAGDYILSIIMDKLTQIGNVEIIKIFSNTIKKMCIGEINQNYDKYKIGTIENYIEKTKNKTAYLFETAFLCCGKLIQDDFDCCNMSEFGLNVGIAFQIRDDLLNILSIDSSKPVNNDIADGIYNAPVIFGGGVENYHAGIEKTRDLLNNYIESARENIKHLPENDYKMALLELLELLNNV